MKVAIVIEYVADREKVRGLQAAHREHLRRYLDSGQLVAAGPLADDAGAIWILDVASEAKGST